MPGNKEYVAKWQKNNKDKVNRNSRKYRERHPDKRREAWRRSSLKKNYGLTLEMWQEMYDLQEGKCLICQREIKLCVDHNHTTGKIRGLLCISCNRDVGVMENRLEEIQKYLKERN